MPSDCGSRLWRHLLFGLDPSRSKLPDAARFSRGLFLGNLARRRALFLTHASLLGHTLDQRRGHCFGQEQVQTCGESTGARHTGPPEIAESSAHSDECTSKDGRLPPAADPESRGAAGQRPWPCPRPGEAYGLDTGGASGRKGHRVNPRTWWMRGGVCVPQARGSASLPQGLRSEPSLRCAAVRLWGLLSDGCP